MHDMSTNDSRGLGVQYCYKWNFAKNRPSFPISEQEAAEKNAAGEEYTAILPPLAGAAHPVLATFVWKNNYAEVQFLDGLGRPHALYAFRKEDALNLFLEQVDVWSYPNDDPTLDIDEAMAIETTIFREDGYVQHVKIEKEENEEVTREYRGVPVEGNWEPVPDFGRYESIGRWER